MRAELVEISDECICWLEVSAEQGTWIKVGIPTQSLAHLNLLPGDEFNWNSETKTATPIVLTPAQELERQQLDRDIEALELEFKRLRNDQT